MSTPAATTAPPPPRGTAPPAPPAPPRPRSEAAQGGRAGRVVRSVSVVVLVAGAGLAAVTLLGKNASTTKFSSVASAICDGRFRAPDPFGGLPVQAGVLGAGFAGVGLGDTTRESASAGCGPVGGGGLANVTPSAPVSPSAALPPAAPGPNAQAGQATSFAVDALDPGTGGGPASAGHDFVSTATLTVQVPGSSAADVAAKKREAITKTAAVGGGLFGEESAFNGEAKATVTLKVPAERFTGLLDDLSNLGELKSQQVKTDEVTQQVIDLDARITAATNGLERSRGLLAKATNLGDIAQLESDVNRRETELETLKGQQQALAQQVALSTIVLTLTSSAPPPVSAASSAPAAPAPAAPAERPLPGFLDGLNGGWKVFTAVGTVVLAACGAVLPFLPVVLLALLAWRLARRNRVQAGTAPTR